jgi:hypothetical protein
VSDIGTYCENPEALRLLRFRKTDTVVNSDQLPARLGPKEIIMKRLLSGLALILAFVTFSYAAAQHSASVTLYETVYIGSNKLPAGDYSLQWPDGSGVVELSIKGSRQNLSVPITVNPQVAKSNGTLVTMSGDKTVLQGFSTKLGTLMIKDAETK